MDLSALNAALEALVQRHDILRTYYPLSEAGEPVQRLAQDWSHELICNDIPGDTTDEQDQALHDALTKLARQPFDLEQAPPLTVALYRLSTEHHVLAVVQHHIAGDGWSVQVLINDLCALYEGACTQRDASLHHCQYSSQIMRFGSSVSSIAVREIAVREIAVRDIVVSGRANLLTGVNASPGIIPR
ncbi:hypothetical protein HORIV_14320 [Vreelandella olivaria]|uniref:Condensation domain-containing protein n=1 Tax=Vreelandella olivaria TaxID=390919 RepID=A0ABM7GEM7_9GAMM|nr:hypothetical protein HORIV_14320 [Halomonas olivaria]